MGRLNAVLFEPEIPQNTGNIVRTCAAVNARLHLIKPLGFSTTDRYLKRAGLDYWHLVDIHYYENLDDFFQSHKGKKFIFFSKHAVQSYDKADYSGEAYLIFGKETTGLPEAVRDKNPAMCFRIPMLEEARSLNLSNAAAIALYEAARQQGFSGLKLKY